MKRPIQCTLLILLLCINAPTGRAQKQLDVFFLPEQGFLRVDSSLLVDINGDSFEFELFPNAQITALWIPNLAKYTIERTRSQTTVRIVLREPTTSPTVLDLVYEGFLAHSHHSTAGILDQSSLWFPSFFIPVTSSPMQITVPRGITAILPGILQNHRETDFSIYTWEIEGYPILRFGSELLLEQRDQIDTHIDTHIDQEEIIEEEVIEETIDVDQAELINTIARWDQALAKRDRVKLASLIHPEFDQQEAFMSYLVDRPSYIETFSTQLTDLEIRDMYSLVTGYLTTNTPTIYQTTSSWQQQGKAWLLRNFNMRPLPELPNAELLQTLEHWFASFYYAVKNSDSTWLTRHLQVPPTQMQPIMQFLESLGSDYEWEIHSLIPRDLEVITLIYLPNQVRLKLIYTMIPTETTWVVSDLKVIPL